MWHKTFNCGPFTDLKTPLKAYSFSLCPPNQPDNNSVIYLITHTLSNTNTYSSSTYCELSVVTEEKSNSSIENLYIPSALYRSKKVQKI